MPLILDENGLPILDENGNPIIDEGGTEATVAATLAAVTSRVRVNTTGAVTSTGFPFIDGCSTPILGG